MGRDPKTLELLIDIAINGQEAVNMFTANCNSDKMYSLIFMDLNMPVKDGFDATKEIREVCNRLKEE